MITCLNTALLFGEQDACYQCHMEIDEDQDAEDQLFGSYTRDVHFIEGLSCADCHGGDPEAFDDEDASMWEADGYIGEITPREEPALCGRCHSDPEFMRHYDPNINTDQEAKYWTSFHGKQLKQGNQKVATCTDCHNVHGILTVDDARSPVFATNIPSTCGKCHASSEYMREFDIPTDQYDHYVTSVHGKALLEKNDIGAPACNDCHGNHGATPPDVSDLSAVCGKCHVSNSDLFNASFLADIFAEKQLPQCESCHGNHGVQKPTDEFLLWTEASPCAQCHEKKYDKAKELSLTLSRSIETLKAHLDSARALTHQAAIKGMEVSELEFGLDNAYKVLLHTRTSIHSFDSSYVKEVALEGLDESQRVIEGANLALANFDFRRRGLFISSILITLLVALLYIKVRQTERDAEQ